MVCLHGCERDCKGYFAMWEETATTETAAATNRNFLIRGVANSWIKKEAL